MHPFRCSSNKGEKNEEKKCHLRFIFHFPCLHHHHRQFYLFIFALGFFLLFHHKYFHFFFHFLFRSLILVHFSFILFFWGNCFSLCAKKVKPKKGKLNTEFPLHCTIDYGNYARISYSLCSLGFLFSYLYSLFSVYNTNTHTHTNYSPLFFITNLVAKRRQKFIEISFCFISFIRT